MSKDPRFRVFVTCDIGPAIELLRERGYEVEVYPSPDQPPKKLIIEKVKGGVDGLITTRRSEGESDAEYQAALFIEIGHWDWYVTKNHNRLHHAVIPREAQAGIAEDWAVLEPVRLRCGQLARGLWIPGFFSRMSLPRCIGCCKAAGIPPGTGSPKNDPAVRLLLEK